MRQRWLEVVRGRKRKKSKMVDIETPETEKETSKSTVKQFGDLYNKSIEFEGEKIEEKELIGKNILIHDFGLLNGQFGQFAIVDATILPAPNEEEGKRVQFSEGSDVIMRQLKAIKEDNNFPIKAVIEERTSEKSKLTYRTLT